MPSTDLLRAWILLSRCDTLERKDVFSADRFATWRFRAAFLAFSSAIAGSFFCCMGSLGVDGFLD